MGVVLSAFHLAGRVFHPTSDHQLSNCFAAHPPCFHGFGRTGRTVPLLLKGQVVVLSADWHTGVLSSQCRQAEIETVLVLLEELQTQAPAGWQPQIHSLSKHLRLALSHVLLFARSLDTIQQQATAQLGAQAVQLLGWGGPRRAILGPTTADLVKSVEPAWQAIAQQLLSAWDQAVRASSAVENWHSIVRPHLAVHHTLSAGMLALLAVWHNHHQAPRGPHLGLSPLQRTGSTQLEIDWLASLGYTALAA